MLLVVMWYQAPILSKVKYVVEQAPLALECESTCKRGCALEALHETAEFLRCWLAATTAAPVTTRAPATTAAGACILPPPCDHECGPATCMLKLEASESLAFCLAATTTEATTTLAPVTTAAPNTTSAGEVAQAGVPDNVLPHAVLVCAGSYGHKQSAHKLANAATTRKPA